MSEAYRFGFSEFTTWPWPFARDVERYPKHGATEIEICEFKLAHGDITALEDLGSLKPASVQMGVHSVFVDSMASTPEDPKDRIAAMKDAIAASAPYLPPKTPFVAITGIAPDKNVKRAVDMTVDALREVGEAAAERGMTVAFEPLNPVNVHTDTAVWSLESGLEIVERVAHPNVGICIDTWNVWQSRDLTKLIGECGKRILLVQMSDWKTPRSTADRYSLGSGEIPLADMMREIRRTGYEGPWIVEILSSLHLEGSLWKQNLDDVLEENYRAFTRLWTESAPNAR